MGIVGLLLEDEVPAELVLDLAPGQKSFAGSLRVSEGAFEELGTGFWETGITPNEAEGGDQPAQMTDVPVTVKLRSLLGQKVTRSGSTVEVFAAAKNYVGGGRYLASAGRPVYVQRYTSTGWQTFRTVTADRKGHIDVRVTIPYRASIRVITFDTPTTFGAVTAAAVV